MEGEVDPGIQETKLQPIAVKKPCTKEEFDKIVEIIVGGLKPYQVDLMKQLKNFNEDSTSSSFDFPCTLTANERQTVHQLADIFGMSHESTGKGQKRFIRCEKKKQIEPYSPSFTEMYYFKGYLGLMGPCVDAFANQVPADAVPSSYKEARARRDGPRHHVTIIAKKELLTIIPAKEGESIDEAAAAKLLDRMVKEVEDNWEDKGLGKVSEGEEVDLNEAYYKIISWESANKFRQELGFPAKDFHITVGFKKNDIHDVTKDLSTLVQYENIILPKETQ